jgi:hypothetical protein
MPNSFQANGAQSVKPKYGLIAAGTVLGKWTVGASTGVGSYDCSCQCGVVRRIGAGELLKGTRSKGCRRCRSGYPEGLCALYSEYKQNAKTRNIQFSLSHSEVLCLVTKPCYYCQKNPSPYIGIDRLANALGYLLENCVPCCSLCNHMKCDMSVEDFLLHVRKIARS